MNKYIYSTGRRKTSSSRVFIQRGDGKLLVNNRDYRKYFFIKKLQLIVFYPFTVIEDNSYFEKINLYITVKGGGIFSQAFSVQHGISRCLCNYDKNLCIRIKNHGLLTRDSRKVERKKFGFRKARRRPQFSKR